MSNVCVRIGGRPGAISGEHGVIREVMKNEGCEGCFRR